jgi:hypothetical protein
MDILPTWVWVVLAGVVLVILAFRIAEVLSNKPKYATGKRPAGKRPAGKRPTGKRPTGKRPTGKRPAKTHRTVADKQRQGSWDKSLEENYDAVISKLSNCGWILVNERDSPDGTKIASFRRQDGLDLLVEKGMAGGMAGGVAGRKLNRGVISYSGTGKKEAEKDLDS